MQFMLHIYFAYIVLYVHKKNQIVPNLVCLGVVMATQQFYVIVDLTGGVGGSLLYFIFPGILTIVVLQKKSDDIDEEFEVSIDSGSEGLLL